MKQLSLALAASILLFGCSSDKESAEFRQAVEQSKPVTETGADTAEQNVSTPPILFAEEKDTIVESDMEEPATREETAALATAEKPATLEQASGAETAPVQDRQPTATVIKVRADDTLNVRKAAGVEHAIMDKLKPGSKVTLTGNKTSLADNQTWREIITASGVTGWVNDHYLKISE